MDEKSRLKKLRAAKGHRARRPRSNKKATRAVNCDIYLQAIATCQRVTMVGAPNLRYLRGVANDRDTPIGSVRWQCFSDSSPIKNNVRYERSRRKGLGWLISPKINPPGVPWITTWDQGDLDVLFGRDGYVERHRLSVDDVLKALKEKYGE